LMVRMCSQPRASGYRALICCRCFTCGHSMQQQQSGL
jgi:hypothetical protein